MNRLPSIWLISNSDTSDLIHTLTDLAQWTGDIFIIGPIPENQVTNKYSIEYKHTFLSENTTWKDIFDKQHGLDAIILHAGVRLVHNDLINIYIDSIKINFLGTYSTLAHSSELNSPDLPISNSNVAIREKLKNFKKHSPVTTLWPSPHAFILPNINRNHFNETSYVFDLNSHAIAFDRMLASGLTHFLDLNYLIDFDHQRKFPHTTKSGVESFFQPHKNLNDLRYLINNFDTAAQRNNKLHIMHSWGGGLERWVYDFCDNDHNNNYILKSIGTWGAFGQRLDLFLSSNLKEPIRSCELNLPNRATSIHNSDYDLFLQEIVTDFNIEIIIISSLIGHTLDTLKQNCKTAVVFHDYYPFCQALYSNYSKPCTSCTPTNLKDCKENNSLNRYFSNVTAEEWYIIRSEYINILDDKSILKIAPSNSVKRRITEVFDFKNGSDICIIPHGINMPYPHIDYINHDRPRILILGGLSKEKGFNIIKSELNKILEYADVYFIGCGDAADSIPNKNVHIHKRYEREQLSNILNEIKPTIALLLSIVPETFSYTLSELKHFAIPVVANDIGSFSDRITSRIDGYLLNLENATLAKSLHQILSDKEALVQIHNNIKSQEKINCDTMVKNYNELFNLPRFSLDRCQHKNNTTNIIDNSWDSQKKVAVVIYEFLNYLKIKTTGSPRLGKFQKKTIILSINCIFWLSLKLNKLIKISK